MGEAGRRAKFYAEFAIARRGSEHAGNIEELVAALDTLARLGGPGGGYGNSIGNEIAQKALKKWEDYRNEKE